MRRNDTKPNWVKKNCLRSSCDAMIAHCAKKKYTTFLRYTSAYSSCSTGLSMSKSSTSWNVLFAVSCGSLAGSIWLVLPTATHKSRIHFRTIWLMCLLWRVPLNSILLTFDFDFTYFICYVFFPCLDFWANFVVSFRGKKTHCEWNFCVKIISVFQVKFFLRCSLLLLIFCFILYFHSDILLVLLTCIFTVLFPESFKNLTFG